MQGRDWEVVRGDGLPHQKEDQQQVRTIYGSVMCFPEGLLTCGRPIHSVDSDCEVL